jgi:hypothetical protein
MGRLEAKNPQKQNGKMVKFEAIFCLEAKREGLK